MISLQDKGELLQFSLSICFIYSRYFDNVELVKTDSRWGPDTEYRLYINDYYEKFLGTIYDHFNIISNGENTRKLIESITLA